MTTTQIIPAAAGYYGLWPADVECGYGRSPIAAWQIEVNGGYVAWCYPITEGVPYDAVATILCPDGSVNQSDSGEFWPSVAEWLADAKAEAARNVVDAGRP